MNSTLAFAVIAGIVLLLILILKLKIPAFISLLITAIVTAILSGLDPSIIMETVKTGMGSTLGFVATIIGLGAIFGGILEHTGSAGTMASFFLSKTGEKGAPMAMMSTGFMVSIPVFFDVGFIILYPILAALHHKTGKSIIHYAIPLLAGLAVGHAFIPPTPGPLAVAEIMGASLGWIVLVGIIVGLPSAYISGIVYGKYIGDKIYIKVPEPIKETDFNIILPDIRMVMPIVVLPILLIVCSTLVDTGILDTGYAVINQYLSLICHPFSALIIANLLAWYILGKKSGLTSNQLAKISSRSLYPAGIIILVTGAGGVYKQVLIDTGAGNMIAESMQQAGFSIVIFAFLAAVLIRVMQGSATVAMITAAGLVAPVLSAFNLSEIQLAALVICIASGSIAVSHLNDSGFWLIKEYLGLTEKQAIQTWTVSSTILGFTGFILAALIFYLS